MKSLAVFKAHIDIKDYDVVLVFVCTFSAHSSLSTSIAAAK